VCSVNSLLVVVLDNYVPDAIPPTASSSVNDVDQLTATPALVKKRKNSDSSQKVEIVSFK
jgi:hypothetical protein